MGRSHITTPLNYRRAVFVRSDFPEYHNFPEVYHAEEIIISLFSALRSASGGQEMTQHIVSRAAEFSTTCLCLQGVALCGGEEDP